MDTQKDNYARKQADAQMAAISEMVAALECDFDRLADLREEREELEPEEREELEALETAAGDCEDREDAETRIMEDALSVEVRSDWRAPGDDSASSEFRILLCTGGPHVELRGELNEYQEPETADLYYSDWFEGLARRGVSDSEEGTLLTYARCFYFGE